jgi:hypothetical protein
MYYEKLPKELFAVLYENMPVAELAKVLRVQLKPIMQRAEKYQLPKKRLGRPNAKVLFKGESKYPKEVTEILEDALNGVYGKVAPTEEEKLKRKKE